MASENKPPESQTPKRTREFVAPPTTFSEENAPRRPKSPIPRPRTPTSRSIPSNSGRKSPRNTPRRTQSPRMTPRKSPRLVSRLPTIDLDEDELQESRSMRSRTSVKSSRSKSSLSSHNRTKSPRRTPRTPRRQSPGGTVTRRTSKSPRRTPKSHTPRKSPRIIAQTVKLPTIDLLADDTGHTNISLSESSTSSPKQFLNGSATTLDFSSGQPIKIEKPPPLTDEERRLVLRNAREYLNANIRLLSACQDGQQTSDCSNVLVRFGLRGSKRGSLVSGYDGGACTSILLKVLYEYHENPEMDTAPKWIDLLHTLRSELTDKGYQQVPALTSSRPVSMKDEFSILPKNYNGSKKALIIGISYEGKTWELPGCHNDCYAMITYLKRVHDFTDADITVLMDDNEHTPPTKENILKAFHRFAFSLKPGDAAFFHYAGHGSSKVDESGDEESGKDQTLLPVDVVENGEIVDDEIFRILLVPLQRGVQLTAIVDCCHSGTIFDLPFEFIGDSKYEDGTEMEFRKVTFPHMKMVRAERARIQTMKEQKEEAAVIEEEIVKPFDARPVNPFTLAKIDERSNSKKQLKLAVPTKEEPAKRSPLARNSNVLMLFGCCLLCLNPLKLLR